MIGNEEDFTASLGFEVPGTSQSLTDLQAAHFQTMIDKVTHEFANLRVVATTLRSVRSATINDWGALAWSAEDGFVQATHRPGLEILDRVGAATPSPRASSTACSSTPTCRPRSSTGRRTGRWL
jgi:2-dehydro-3-deoxygluconokinase